MTFNNIQQTYQLSPDAMERLEHYVQLLLKWNVKINLIGKTTESDIWERHIVDALQLLKYIPQSAKTLTDFGTGAGIPGVILALTGKLEHIHLIESNRKKCAFLNEAASLATGQVTIHAERIENLAPWASDIITARALAPLNQLASLTYPFTKTETILLLHKGKQVAEEIEKWHQDWGGDVIRHQSQTSTLSTVIEIKNMTPKGV